MTGHPGHRKSPLLNHTKDAVPITEQDPILAFFRRTGTDHARRRHADILAWPDGRIESGHDYIQWLFPLRERSHFNPDAPVLQQETIEAFVGDPGLKGTLIAGFNRMANFYGFVVTPFADGSVQLDLAPDFAARSRNWLTPANHNYLRLTRILTSLRTLGCEDEAEALFDVLDVVYRRNRTLIGETTYAFWCSAAAQAANQRWDDRR